MLENLQRTQIVKATMLKSHTPIKANLHLHFINTMGNIFVLRLGTPSLLHLWIYYVCLLSDF